MKFFLVSGLTRLVKIGGLKKSVIDSLARKIHVRILLLVHGESLTLCGIQRHGRRIVAQMGPAGVWIADGIALEMYKQYCAHDPDHRDERPLFVQRCIDQRRLIPEFIPQKRRMHGRHPGQCATSSCVTC